MVLESQLGVENEQESIGRVFIAVQTEDKGRGQCNGKIISAHRTDFKTANGKRVTTLNNDKRYSIFLHADHRGRVV
jgi:hypothetical protein